MDRRPASDPSFWHYLIKDQRATEQLDQLCHGLAQVIVSQTSSPMPLHRNPVDPTELLTALIIARDTH